MLESRRQEATRTSRPSSACHRPRVHRLRGHLEADELADDLAVVEGNNRVRKFLATHLERCRMVSVVEHRIPLVSTYLDKDSRWVKYWGVLYQRHAGARRRAGRYGYEVDAVLHNARNLALILLPLWQLPVLVR